MHDDITGSLVAVNVVLLLIVLTVLMIAWLDFRDFRQKIEAELAKYNNASWRIVRTSFPPSRVLEENQDRPKT